MASICIPAHSRWRAAYFFHLARNHPFVDANKRTALMCALVFLGLIGARLRADPDDLYSLVDGVAAGEVDKAEVSVFIRRHCVDT
jgi:death-on-curing protein